MTDDEEEEENLYNLFVCEDYTEKPFVFEDVQLTLLCSSMCTTDHDLTGQIIWPACRILSWFLVKHPDTVRDRSVVELGAGCGLGGFVAAHFARQVEVTDGNDIVLRLLEKNQRHLALKHVSVRKLMWGIKSDLFPAGSDGKEGPDVVIGADVILWPNQLVPLIRTIRWYLLNRDGNGCCYISYVHRANTTFSLLERLVDECGLSMKVISAADFIPPECEDLLRIDARMLIISLLPSTLARKEEIMAMSDSDIVEQNQFQSLPC